MNDSNRYILVLNLGSSSIKSKLFKIGSTETGTAPRFPLWAGSVELNALEKKGKLVARSARGSEERIVPFLGLDVPIRELLGTAWEGKTAVIKSKESISLIAHRVVHGGEKFSAPTQITPSVMEAIRGLFTLAPLHNPISFSGIEACVVFFGKTMPQVALFDTAFHSSMTLPTALYAIPLKFREEGIRRYGFHGINHKYASSRVRSLLPPDIADPKIVVCHLGAGASLCAVKNGKSIDTTMGYTPNEGLMMATRSGTVDPGILLYLEKKRGLSPEKVDRLLNNESGLLGVSGVSGDFREILAAMEKGHENAKLAFDMFLHRLCQGIGAMSASLGGIDVLIFTAGIGEHAALVREKVGQQLGFLGIEIDPEKNSKRTGDQEISSASSRVKVFVIEANEEWQMAVEASELVLK